MWRVEKKRRSMFFTSPVGGLSALTDGWTCFSTSLVKLWLKVCLFYHCNVRWRMMSVIIFSAADILETGGSDVTHTACPRCIVTVLILFLCWCVFSLSLSLCGADSILLFLLLSVTHSSSLSLPLPLSLYIYCICLYMSPCADVFRTESKVFKESVAPWQPLRCNQVDGSLSLPQLGPEGALLVIFTSGLCIYILKEEDLQHG